MICPILSSNISENKNLTPPSPNVTSTMLIEPAILNCHFEKNNNKHTGISELRTPRQIYLSQQAVVIYSTLDTFTEVVFW